MWLSMCCPSQEYTDPTEPASFLKQHHQMESLSQWCTVGWHRAKNTCLFLTFLCAEISAWCMGHNLFVSHFRPKSDEKYMWNVECSVSENIKECSEPVKLMIQIDFCTKQREERIGYCMRRGHSSSSCVFYNLLSHNVSPI